MLDSTSNVNGPVAAEVAAVEAGAVAGAAGAVGEVGEVVAVVANGVVAPEWWPWGRAG